MALSPLNVVVPGQSGPQVVTQLLKNPGRRAGYLWKAAVMVVREAVHRVHMWERPPVPGTPQSLQPRSPFSEKEEARRARP